MNNINEIIKNKKNIDINFKKNHNNDFENFLLKNIKNDIPKCFTSGLSVIYSKSNKIKLNPDVLVASSSYIHNEFLKFWILQKKINDKKKLIIIEHGGSHQKKSLGWFNFQQNLADLYIPWVKVKNNENYNNQYNIFK